ncbi:MAG: hypothetical protein L3K00_06585 [Thermoplasmata archaeon]|nr:hypothetical protein [Thermoplasmata archaeon]
MATYAEPGSLSPSVPRSSLSDRIEATLADEPLRPWCVHRLYEELAAPEGLGDREHGLLQTQYAADSLAHDGRVRRETVSAVTIGVQCQDTVYWSPRSECEHLEEFGPDYEAPAILHRLGAHFQCHGL